MLIAIAALLLGVFLLFRFMKGAGFMSTVEDWTYIFGPRFIKLNDKQKKKFRILSRVRLFMGMIVCFTVGIGILIILFFGK